MKPLTRRQSIAAVVAVAMIVAGFLVVRRDRHATVRFGISSTNTALYAHPILPASGGWPHSQLIARDWGIAEDLNLEIELVPRIAGRGALATLIDGNADYAVVAATPIVEALSRGNELLILAQTERSNRQMRVVTHADHVDDWYQHPIALMTGTAMESALVADLDLTGHLDLFRDGTLQTMGLPSTDKVVTAIVDGSATSAVLLQPQAALLTRPSAEHPEPEYVDITPPDMYQFTSYLVTTPERWKANHDAIVLAMKATRMTREMIHDEPELRLLEIHNFEAGETRLRDTPPLFWEEDEIVFVTSAALVSESLAHEARLMASGGLIDTAPDFKPALSVLAEIEAAT